MSLSTELPSVSPTDSETRNILGPGGNRVKVFQEKASLKKNKDVRNKPKSCVKLPKTPRNIVITKTDLSVNSSSSLKSSSSSSNGSSVKLRISKRNNKPKTEGKEAVTTFSMPFKRCEWITQFSDPLHVSFHDEEWGVPVHEDNKLFELLVLSQASSELTWPEIHYKRDKFRIIFENFDPSSIAKMSEVRLLSLAKVNGISLLSEQKLRAVVGNAIQLLKIQQEFGSFSTYCWQFINHKQISNRFRYGRQIPSKTPKSEAISKDLMKRGFHFVGPTVIYSFMQVSGMVNDHLISCFRYNNSVIKDLNPHE